MRSLSLKRIIIKTRERSGIVLDSRPTTGLDSPASLRCGPYARHIYPSLVLVKPRKIRPYITERLLMGRKESNQTKKVIKEMFQRSLTANCLLWGLIVSIPDVCFFLLL